MYNTDLLNKLDDHISDLNARIEYLTQVIEEYKSENKRLRDEIDEVVPPRLKGFQWAMDSLKQFAESLR